MGNQYASGSVTLYLIDAINDFGDDLQKIICELSQLNPRKLDRSEFILDGNPARRIMLNTIFHYNELATLAHEYLGATASGWKKASRDEKIVAESVVVQIFTITKGDVQKGHLNLLLKICAKWRDEGRTAVDLLAFLERIQASDCPSLLVAINESEKACFGTESFNVTDLERILSGHC